jgi:DNA-binding response OmpR family regulator
MFLAEAAQWRPVMSTLLTAEPGPNTVQYPSHPFTASSAERRQPLTTQQLAARQAPPHGSVLIVEDSADLRDYLTRLLGGDGWAVTPVADAETALRHQHIPDLVLVDVMLPGRDGLDLLRALRASTSVGGVPVILLTARAGPESVAEGLANGANDYLVKPFEPVELLARVRATVELNRRREIPLKRALDRAENLQLAVSTNRQIGTAVGILMAKRKLRSEQAFELLSATSQAMHRKLSELAEEIVVAGTPAALDG